MKLSVFLFADWNFSLWKIKMKLSAGLTQIEVSNGLQFN
jgi:hypothetical protein